jgi:Zn-dependent protease/predicted transcriptional regulator
MFGKPFEIFRLFGIAVRVDASWFLILMLVIWSLRAAWFPAVLPDLPPGSYWLLGTIGALGLFASVVVHEFAHALVARAQGTPMKGITLFLFGGVAQMGEEPKSAKAEWQMAGAGPLLSIVLGLVFLGAARLLEPRPWSAAVLGYLGTINLLLAAFNLLPAFPLDGGRILRALIWQRRGSLRSATRTAAKIGSGFGVALILLALFSVFTGNIVTGIWWFLIGMFLRNAAQASYQQLLLKRALEGEPVRRFMQAEPITVPLSINVQQLVDDYIYRYYHKMFPVVDGEKLVGCVATKDIRTLPRESWSRHGVDEIVHRNLADFTVAPDEDAVKVLGRMSKNGISRLMVVEDGKLLGVLTLKDLLRFFSLKVELEEEDDQALSESRKLAEQSLLAGAREA